MKEGWHITNSYPTRSLREYLAYQSVDHTEHHDPPQSAPPRIEVEIEVGDGRSQVIVVDAQTDIEREAQNFCRKHHLEDYVSELLANTIREKYEMEKEEALSQTLAEEHQSVSELYSNPHAREVLITSEPETMRHNRVGEGGRRKSSEKGASRILRGSYYRAKKYSLADNYLIQNKENQPELNKVSLQICQKLGKENILEHKNRKSREKINALIRERQEKQEEELRECPFQPKINAISKEVDREIAYSSLQQQRAQRFERLYEDHRQMERRREQERQNYLQEIPFKPTLNYISRKIVEGKRAVNESQETIEKKPHTSCSHSSNHSQPHTGRKPKNRNTQNLPIGEYLYAQAMKKSKPKQVENKTEIKALDHSDRLIAALKEKRINQVFTELTNPPHEELFCEDIDLTNEPFITGKYRLFIPIFNEMAAMDISVTRAEFLQASLTLIKTMSPQEKHEIIFPKERDTQDHPQNSMNNSKSIEMIKRHAYDHSDIYNRGIEHRKYVEEKNEKHRQNRARDELRQCTFKPIIRQPN